LQLRGIHQTVAPQASGVGGDPPGDDKYVANCAGASIDRDLYTNLDCRNQESVDDGIDQESRMLSVRGEHDPVAKDQLTYGPRMCDAEWKGNCTYRQACPVDFSRCDIHLQWWQSSQ
jgi:hypothetical protein